MAKKQTQKNKKEEKTSEEITPLPVIPAAEEITRKAAKPKKTKKKNALHGKKYDEKAHLVNKDKYYSLDEALRLAQKTSFVRFDASVEAHFNLGLDSTKDDQKVRTTVVLPHGTGKAVKVLVFTSIEAIKEVREAGADLIGDDKKIEEIGKGIIDFDVVVADPSFMARLSKVAKVLGPKGLMPNPKSGTVTADPVKAVKDLKKGKVELKTEGNAPLLHVAIGKVSFDAEKLKENFLTVYTTLKNAKPAKTKGVFIQSLTISTTMGPGIKVDLNSLN